MNTKKASKDAVITVGRRKTAIARVRLFSGSGNIVVNGIEPSRYFPTPHLQNVIFAAQKLSKMDDKIDLFVRVNGGGLNGQAEACRLGISRALQTYKPEHRLILKKAGFLRRDSRMVERKKYGLHKARKGTQFSKR